MHVPVVTKCHVWADLKVKLTSNDENISKAISSNEIIIPKGKSEGEFIVHAMVPGMARLKASADNYDFTDTSLEIHKDSADVVAPVNETIQISPVDITLKVGEYFQLSIT